MLCLEIDLDISLFNGWTAHRLTVCRFFKFMAVKYLDTL